MSRDHIRVIDDYRYCHDNEFFFTYDPKRTTGTKQLLEYLEKNFNIEFQDIPGWQIKSTIVNSYGTYEDREKYAIRVIRNDS